MSALKGLDQNTPAILGTAPAPPGNDKNNTQEHKPSHPQSSPRIGCMYYALPNPTSYFEESQDSPHSTSQADAPENPIPPLLHNEESLPPHHPDEQAQSDGYNYQSVAKQRQHSVPYDVE
jgi:hypothetical protein